MNTVATLQFSNIFIIYHFTIVHTKLKGIVRVCILEVLAGAVARLLKVMK